MIMLVPSGGSRVGSGGLSETKLFHFHGIFKKNEVKQQSELTPTALYI